MAGGFTSSPDILEVDWANRETVSYDLLKYVLQLRAIFYIELSENFRIVSRLPLKVCRAPGCDQHKCSHERMCKKGSVAHGFAALGGFLGASASR